MAYILSIETAGPACSVALHYQGGLVGATACVGEQTHARLLSLQIEAIMSQAALGYEQLGAVAVSAGPGSYTGLRIGISTAKGICFGLGIGLIGLPTLEVMAAAARTNLAGTLLLPMLDARRMEIYTALYSWHQSGPQVLEPATPHILDTHSFAHLPAQTTKIFFGSGAAKARPILELLPNMYWADLPYPMAADMGMLAWKRYQNNAFENGASFDPMYLKQANVTLPKSV